MNANLSVWLDLSRIIAALVVFIGHSTALGISPQGIPIAWHRSADDAVIAFFVISGLVIAHTTRVGNADVNSYALGRLSRVYSGALPAVLFALTVDHIGMRLDVTQYSPSWQYPKLWLYLPFHWLFLGETWFGAIQPFTMAPYWSLVYEVWYYILFGCVTFLRGRVRWIVLAVVLAIMGPAIWLLLPTWWLGVLLYRGLERMQVGDRVALGLMLLSLSGYTLYLISGLRSATDVASQGLYAQFSAVSPLPFNRGSTVHVLSDYVVAALFALFVVGCSRSRPDFSPRAITAIRQIAGYTFTFYLVHYTLLVFARAIGLAHVGWLEYWAILAAVCFVSWSLAQVGEQRRDVFRRLFVRILRIPKSP